MMIFHLLNDNSFDDDDDAFLFAAAEQIGNARHWNEA